MGRKQCRWGGSGLGGCAGRVEVCGCAAGAGTNSQIPADAGRVGFKIYGPGAGKNFNLRRFIVSKKEAA